MGAPRIRGLVPAAGRGERLGGDRPKQYLALGNRSLLEHSVEALLAHPLIEGVTVALAAGDDRFARLRFSRPDAVDTAPGGATRAESVRNALRHIEAKHDSDWVLVHDAARPCLSRACLDALLEQGLDDPDGALLALPVADTLKAGDRRSRVLSTVDREGLWTAQTPQLFPARTLQAALEQALASGRRPTDEAEAMEVAGHHPRLVRGDAGNLKVTWPSDLVLAEAVLAARAGPGAAEGASQ